MGKFIDLTGQRFGRLTVLDKAENKCGKTRWNCVCDCGNKTSVFSFLLKNGEVKSCGCFHKEVLKKPKTHGLYNTKLFFIFKSILSRCYNKNNHKYKNYGARGISVCKDWKNDKSKFFKWCLENGYKEGLTIDRINTNGNYEPSNCRFVDMKTQQRNRTNNRLVSFNGETKCISEWCELYNLKVRYFYKHDDSFLLEVLNDRTNNSIKCG